jgi:hypothetical protein
LLGIVGGSPRSRAIGAVVGALSGADVLPGPGDTPTRSLLINDAFARRVPGMNFWVWYTLDGNAVNVVYLSTGPPVPRDS